MSSEADVTAVLARLEEYIAATGCLCLSSRCQIHGESEGLLASTHVALTRVSDLLQRYEAALRDIANYYAYCRDTQGEGDSPCARRAREALALDSPATQETVE